MFLRNSTLLILCSPDEGAAEERLVRPQFGMRRFSWDGVEFHLAHGDWIRLLRANGFEIEDLIEIQAPPDARTHKHYDFVTAEWGRKWPAEEIWKVGSARPDPGVDLAAAARDSRAAADSFRGRRALATRGGGRSG